MYINRFVKTGQVIILMIIMMLLAGIPAAESQVLDPTASFTVRDYGTSGLFYDDTNDSSGFYGYVSYPPLFTGEHFVEFDISASELAAQVVFDFNISNLNTLEGVSDSKDFKIAYYSGSGSANTSVFGTGTWLDDYTISNLGTENFAVDVTSIYNSFIGSGENYLGFRIYEPVWTDASSTGNQVNYMDSTLVTVVPEPISSVLFIFGATTLCARHYRKRKRKRI